MAVKRWVLIAMLCVLCLAGCQNEPQPTLAKPQPIAAVGTWVCDDHPEYYFKLYKNGNCIMFNADDEWVSAGSYESFSNYIAFEMDTGSFTWALSDAGMTFEVNGETRIYHLKQ